MPIPASAATLQFSEASVDPTETPFAGETIAGAAGQVESIFIQAHFQSPSWAADHFPRTQKEYEPSVEKLEPL